MDTTQMTILAIKGHAFNVIYDILADVWEYGNDKKATAHTLFEINGAIMMAKGMMQAVKQADEGSDDDKST